MIALRENFPNQPEPDDEPAIDPLWLPNEVDRVFSAQGALAQALNLEHRPEQEEMALSVAGALSGDTPLLFEAGTGVGKSLAYLIPGLLWAQKAERQCVVSTNTIALQEQIQQKDLEICRQLFQKVPGLQEFAEFRTALLIGKGNYLCGTRLAQALNSKTELFPTDEQDELERIRKWANETETGIVHELYPAPSGEVWDWVNADSHACSSKHCTPETCFYRRARQQVQKAHVLIVNHSLLFALIGSGYRPGPNEKGILHPKDFAILDEAHTVPGVATEHFGLHLSSYGLNRLLYRLYNPKRKKGFLMHYGNRWEQKAAMTAVEAAQVFFEQVRADVLSKRDLTRLYTEQWTEPTLKEPLAALVQRLGDVANRLDEGPAQEEIRGMRSRLVEYNAAINDCIALGQDDHVYWAEKSGRTGSIVTLRAAPVDVAPYLREHLFARQTGLVCTSATLADGADLSGYRERTGSEGANGVQVGSPFDFERRMKVYVASDAPAPDRSEGRLDRRWLADMVQFCTLRATGGTLVLWTSYADMRAVAEQIEEAFVAAGRRFFMQGRDGSRSELRQRFADAGNGILFGTGSFWNGIDVPGPACSQVIVTRLPFENPSHPIAEARSEWLRNRGENPFAKMTLPEAVVQFRQGIGRLIRTRQDFGTITLLDSRIVKREYGRRFLAVLPNPQYQTFTRANRETLFHPLNSL